MSEVARLEGVGRTFGPREEVTALADVDLAIEEGAFVAVEGPSGSGKSTLLNILGLLDTPSTGRYRLDGNDVTGLRAGEAARARAEFLGFVFQSYHLLAAKNVIDNVVLGASYRAIRRRERYRRAFDVLDELGLAHRVTAMPPTLSGGEQQRVAIARAVIGGKRLLLCDEPTGNLDSENTRKVVEVLRRMAHEGIAVVVATHDPMVARESDATVRLVDGHPVT
ncbi:MAG: ABC transporter ATP-binding protein [Actinobacteria bacterium]|nr:ABC transporter ATP-binding protein [Actinomycetota bacterium]